MARNKQRSDGECIDCGVEVDPEDAFCGVCLEDLCESCSDSHMEEYHGNGGDDL